jgi:glycosyltransferase involved in cell wall biosynthesis
MESVLVLTHGFQPAYEKAFVNGLARNGVRVILIGSDRTLVSELHPAVECLNLRGSQDPKRSKLVKAVTIARYVIRLIAYLLAARPAAIHLAGMLIGGVGLLARIECRLYSLLARRLVMTVHNLRPHDASGVSDSGLAALYAIPDVLVVHTNKAKIRLVEEFKVHSERIVVMQHGVDDVAASPFAASGESGRTSILLFGSVCRYKGADLLLRSLLLLEDVPFRVFIVGECRDENYAREIMRLMSQCSKAHDVEWLRGYLPENRVQAMFENADFAVLPYRQIDQSGVLFTALRFGTPVIAFDVGSFSEYLGDGVGRLVTDHSVEALAEALRSVGLSRGGFDRDTVKLHASQFKWEQTVRSVLPYYVASS